MNGRIRAVTCCNASGPVSGPIVIGGRANSENLGHNSDSACPWDSRCWLTLHSRGTGVQVAAMAQHRAGEERARGLDSPRPPGQGGVQAAGTEATEQPLLLQPCRSSRPGARSLGNLGSVCLSSFARLADGWAHTEGWGLTYAPLPCVQSCGCGLPVGKSQVISA